MERNVLSDDSSEPAFDPGRVLRVLLGICLGILSLALLVYHSAVIFGLSASVARILFAALGVLIAAILFRSFGDSIRISSPDWAFLGAFGVLALAVVIVVLSVSRPDADDVQLFHRAILQAQNPDQPFILSDQLFDVPDLPRSTVGVASAYELLVALSSSAVGIDPLQAYHNLFPAISALLWVAVYISMFLEVGLGRRSSILATACAVVFLLVDGNLHRTFGNFSLIRLWQGKVILCSVVVPATVLWTWRYIKQPSVSRWIPVVTCALAGVALSGSGLFMVPATIGATALSALIVEGPRRRRLLACLALVLATGYNGAVLALMLCGRLQNYNLTGYYSGWPSTWSGNAGLVLANGFNWVAAALALFLVPAACLRRRGACFLTAYSLVVGLLFLNPWTGQIWIHYLTPGAYWRLFYLLPLPLCTGLALAYLLTNIGSLFRMNRRTVIVTLFFLVWVASIRHTVLNLPEGGVAPVRWKAPSALRLEPDTEIFVRQIETLLENRTTLAARPLIPALALLHPEGKLYAARRSQTVRRFEMIHRRPEGVQRIAAQMRVSSCDLKPNVTRDQALLQSLDDGVDLVLAKDCGDEGIEQLLLLLQRRGSWVVAHRAQDWLAALPDSPTGDDAELRN